MNTNVAYQNPRLINGYIPVVKEVSKQQALQCIDNFMCSLQTEGWFCNTSKSKEVMYEEEDVLYEKTEEEQREKNKTEEMDKQKLWEIRCNFTKEVASGMVVTLKKSPMIMNHPDRYNYFVCYIGSVPIGMLLLTLFYYDKDDTFQENEPLYPEIHLLVTHPGIQNCASLLVERAVNKSYEFGCLGNLRVPVKNNSKILSDNVYARMGFTKFTNDQAVDMKLKPSESHLWLFSPSHGGYLYKGYC
ncbi:hypothetical protein [Xenorhabdus koppenhoeferi]|uniref:hypothetical protein n=1 Tax=Xenorhabdus koppenhoeferi TaxID=351659 RepID=UPI002B40B8B7|nr:hypothetical protein [Xenorhabdus sp. Vera]